jgi:hypothetical protein
MAFPKSGQSTERRLSDPYAPSTPGKRKAGVILLNLVDTPLLDLVFQFDGKVCADVF